MNSSDISAFVDQLCSIYDQSVANLREALAAYCEQGVHPDPSSGPKALSLIPSCGSVSGDRTAARSPAHSPGSTSPAPTPAASPGRRCSATISTSSSSISSATMASRSRSAAPQRDSLPLCARRQRDRSRRSHRGGAVALVPVQRAGPHRRRDRRRRVGLAAFGERGRWRCSTARAPISASRACKHYTGTPTEHFQHFILFTNYVRYVDEFVRFASRRAAPARTAATPALSVPGGYLRARRPDRRRGADRRRHVAAAPDAGLSPDRARTAPASPWSTSASARPTPRRSATISPCCGRKCG